MRQRAPGVLTDGSSDAFGGNGRTERVSCLIHRIFARADSAAQPLALQNAARNHSQFDLTTPAAAVAAKRVRNAGASPGNLQHRNPEINRRHARGAQDGDCCDGKCFEMKNGKATCEKTCPDDKDYKCYEAPCKGSGGSCSKGGDCCDGRDCFLKKNGDGTCEKLCGNQMAVCPMA